MHEGCIAYFTYIAAGSAVLLHSRSPCNFYTLT